MSSLCRRVALAVLVAVLAAPAPGSGQLLVPMDDAQENHLKAYGLAFKVLEAEERAEWLLNYRDGSFIIPDMPAVRRMAALMGVAVEPVGPAEIARIRAEIESSNMESVPLERAPKVAVYTPPNSSPWMMP